MPSCGWITQRIRSHASAGPSRPRVRVFRNLSIGGVHLHHLVFGILLLLISGYLGIALDWRGLREATAVTFGIGAAVTLDEFALWLRLEDVYWAKEARRSVDAVLLAAALAGVGLLGLGFLKGFGRAIARLLGFEIELFP